MALIKCEECGKEISSLATACPNCGFPVRREGSGESAIPPVQNKDAPDADADNKGCAIALLVAIALALILGVTTCTGGQESSQSSPEEIANSITAYCANEAGIPDRPNDHAITPSEMSKITACVDKQMRGR